MTPDDNVNKSYKTYQEETFTKCVENILNETFFEQKKKRN